MSGLTKIAVNLRPRSVEALQQAGEATGDNQTDVLNRSVVLYAEVAKAMRDGKRLVVEDPATGDRERLMLL